MRFHFIKKLLLFALWLGVLGFVVQWILIYGLTHYRTSSRGVWNQIVRGEVNADIVICGSSRAEVHYDPRVIASVTGMTAYNLGMSGTGHILQAGRLQAYLERNKKPDMIIINFDTGSFGDTKQIYYPRQYIPYLHNPDLYKRLCSLNHDFIPFRRFPLLGIIKYRLFVESVQGLLGAEGAEDCFSGYKPEKQEWTGEFDKFKSLHPGGVEASLDKGAIQDLSELVSICREAGAGVLLVYSPEYIESQRLTKNRHVVMSTVRQIAANNDVEFWDYSRDPICFNRDYFYNSQHMNQQGATLFSNALAEQLKTTRKAGGLPQ